MTSQLEIVQVLTLFQETKILVSQVHQTQLNPSTTWFVPLKQQEIQH